MAGPFRQPAYSYDGDIGQYAPAQNVAQLSSSTTFYVSPQEYQQPFYDPSNAPFPKLDEPPRQVLPHAGPSRIRKRVNHGGEHVKFRRTRTGCYTCRNRRVKCDETRPQCERCRKGNRDCLYPETQPKSQSSSSKSRTGQDDEESLTDSDDPDDLGLYEEPPRSAVEEPSSTASDAQVLDTISETSSRALRTASKSLSVTESQTAINPSTPRLARAEPFPGRTMTDLPEDFRFYLQYARANLTNHHWGVRMDHQDFLVKTMIEVGLRYEPLLYAVVCFAAYHHSLEKPDGKMEDFLSYYQKSVRLLRENFPQRPTIATIMTILQLATIEEFFGDWVNLMHHQQAALLLITKLYTPQKMIAHETLRKVLHWYTRFDIFVNIISGHATKLGREWFALQYEFYQQQCNLYPEVLTWKFEERYCWIRLAGYDMQSLATRKLEGALDPQEFLEKLMVFSEQVKHLYDSLDPAILDAAYRHKDISQGRTCESDALVDPFEPDLLYGGKLFDTNLVVHDLICFEILFMNHVGSMTGKIDMDKRRKLALKLGQLHEAMTLAPDAPRGIRLGLQAGVALSVLFLNPENEREIMWARRKLASIEASGYIYSGPLRTRLEYLWGLDLSNWWLPNDEGCPEIVKRIREWASSQPKDDLTESLYELKGIFAVLSLTEGSKPAPQEPTRPRLDRKWSSRSDDGASSTEEQGDFDAEIMEVHDRSWEERDGSQEEYTSRPLT